MSASYEAGPKQRSLSTAIWKGLNSVCRSYEEGRAQAGLALPIFPSI